MANRLYCVTNKRDVLDFRLVIAKSQAQAIRYVEEEMWEASIPSAMEVAEMTGKMGIQVQDATGEDVITGEDE